MVKVFADRFPVGTQGNVTDGYYMDGILQKNFDLAKEEIKKDWDMVFVLDGQEGAGKSVLAQQIGYYCDPQLELKRIVFSPDDFKKQVINCKRKNACIIFDEAYGGLSSRKAMSDVNQGLVSMLAEIRQKNLFVIIVLPTFFDLDKYVALWRSRALVHVYADRFKRGYFKFFSYNKKKKLYVNGKKFYNYNVAQPDFIGRFTNFYPIGDKEYREKKRKSLRAYDPGAGFNITQTRNDIQAEIYQKILSYMYHNQKRHKLSKQAIADMTGLHKNTVHKYLNNLPLAQAHA